jgi:Fur family ferric uptake transcriptional regulator
MPSPDARFLRQRGERLTPQRLLVLDAVRQHSGHLSVEEVLAQVQAQFPTINRTTIYRALAWLNEQGLVSVTDVGREGAVYEYLTPQRHHHLICQSCGEGQKIPDDLIFPMIEAIRQHYDFEPRLDHLALFGLCRSCRDQPVTAPEPERA